MAIRSSVRETVCVVTVLDDHFRESLHAQEQVANLEDVFMAFGPPVKRTPDMSESRMRSLVHTSPSQVHLTMRGMWRDFCT